MSKRMKLIFTVSLLLNIVFIGVGAGMLFRYCQDIPIPGAMSPEARNFVARTYQNGREGIRPLIDEVKERRRKVETILESDTFERDAYDKAVNDLLATQAKIMRHRADTMGKALAELSDEDRKEFSSQIIDGLTPGRPRHHRNWKQDGKPKEERKSDR